MLRTVDELLCECMPLFPWEIKYSLNISLSFNLVSSKLWNLFFPLYQGSSSCSFRTKVKSLLHEPHVYKAS